MEKEFDKSTNVLNKIKSYLNDSLLEGHVLENLEEMYEDSMKKEKTANFNMDKHEMMSKFESRVAKMEQSTIERERMEDELKSSDDEESNENEISTLDPVTNQEMSEPMKNTICGHSYEQSSVLRLLKKQGMRCPVAGCSNILRKNDLVDDVELKQLILEK